MTFEYICFDQILLPNIIIMLQLRSNEVFNTNFVFNTTSKRYFSSKFAILIQF